MHRCVGRTWCFLWASKVVSGLESVCCWIFRHWVACLLIVFSPDLQQRHPGGQRAAEVHHGQVEPTSQLHPGCHSQRHGHPRLGSAQHEVRHQGTSIIFLRCRRSVIIKCNPSMHQISGLYRSKNVDPNPNPKRPVMLLHIPDLDPSNILKVGPERVRAEICHKITTRTRHRQNYYLKVRKSTESPNLEHIYFTIFGGINIWSLLII